MKKLPMIVFGKTLGIFEVKSISLKPKVSEFIVHENQLIDIFLEIYCSLPTK